MKKVLALDFDGVLCDTIDECLITSVNAYRQLNDLPGRFSIIKQIDPEWVKLFCAIRPFVRPAGEYWITAHWLHTRKSALTFEVFERLRSENADLIDDFRSRFFAARAELRNQDEQKWINLHKPFTQATEKLSELADQFEICFVTNKDLASIRILGKQFGLDLPESAMFTGDEGRSKPDSIREIIRQRGIPVEDVLFVDDQLDHLMDVEKTGARCFWASWGYERDTDREHHFVKLNRLQDVIVI